MCRTARFTNWNIIIQLGRRTTEITTLSLQVSNAEINNTENSYTINIKNHKTRKHDKNAYIAFNEPEFQILQTFIKDYRPELTSDKNPDSPVFPIKTDKSSKSCKLSLQNVHRIIKKIQDGRKRYLNFKTYNKKYCFACD